MSLQETHSAILRAGAISKDLYAPQSAPAGFLWAWTLETDRKPMTLTDALDAFLLDCGARQLKPKTLRFYRQQLGAAVTWLLGQGVEVLDSIEATHLRRFVMGLQERGLSAASQHAAARSLRTWLYWCEREDLLTGKNPARKIRMPKRDQKLLPAVSMDDVRRLLEACNRSKDPLRDRALLRVLVDTGIRAAELCGLIVGDLAGGRLLIRNGKGGKDRAVFLADTTRRAVVAYLGTRPGVRSGAALFVSHETGRALTYDGLKELLGRLGERAGVAVHAHALRRTFAVESLRGGCDLVSLARMMGHADLQMLQACYLPLLEDDLQAAHRRSSPGERLGS